MNDNRERSERGAPAHDPVPVTAKAREAAAALIRKVGHRTEYLSEIECGDYDDNFFVQAFARFERDILARHRGSTAVVDAQKIADCIAAAIEFGEHGITVNVEQATHAIVASLSQTPATPMDELQRLGQEFGLEDAKASMLETARELRENANGDCSAIQQAIAWEARAALIEATPMVQEGLREALADHFPTGLRSQYARTAGGISVSGGGIAVECKCGWSTVATDDDEARQQWADHVAALSATPAQEEEG